MIFALSVNYIVTSQSGLSLRVISGTTNWHKFIMAFSTEEMMLPMACLRLLA